MAVNDITSSAGPFTGNGVTTVFPFDFAAFDESEVVVTVNSVSVVSGYSVSLTFDVNGSPTGGNVTFGVAPVNGAIVMLLSDPDFTQSTMFTRYGPYFPDFVNRPLDRAAVRAIYLRGIAQRAVTVPIGQAGFTLPSTIDSAALVTLASIAPAISAVAANATNINTVAGIAANITTVAGLAANIVTLAGISANITAVAGNAANITAVAGALTNINAVAGSIANVNAVAGSISNVNAVATDLALGAGASYILRAPQAAIDAAASAAAAAASAAAIVIPPNGTMQRWVDLGGTASAATLLAMRTLEFRLRAWGLDRGDLITLNMLWGTGTLSPRIPFYLAPGIGGNVPITGTISTFTEANGLVLTGGTGLDTGIKVQNAGLGHYGVGLGVYLGSNLNADNGFVIGGSSGIWGFNPYSGSPSFASSSFIFFDFTSRILGDPRIDHIDGGVGNATYVATGAMAGVRDAAGNGFVMRDGVSLQGGSFAGAVNDPTSTFPTTETFVVRGNTVHPYAYFITRGITEARMAALMWIIEEAQIAVGRLADKSGL